MDPKVEKPDGGGKRAWLTPRRIVAAVALVLAVVLILQNNRRVKLNFLFFSGHPRVWFGFLIALVLGFLLGWGLSARRAKSKTPES